MKQDNTFSIKRYECTNDSPVEIESLTFSHKYTGSNRTPVHAIGPEKSGY